MSDQKRQSTLMQTFSNVFSAAFPQNDIEGVGVGIGDMGYDLTGMGGSMAFDGEMGSPDLSRSDLPAREITNIDGGYDALSRRQRYASYEHLEELIPEIHSGLNTYADEACSYDDENHVLQIRCSNEAVKDELKFLFFNSNTIDVDSRAWGMTRNICKFGDGFWEAVIDPQNPQFGILKLNELDPHTMWRIQSKKGTLLEFQQTLTSPDYDVVIKDIKEKHNRDKDPYQSLIWSGRKNTSKNLIRFAPAQVVHVRIGQEERGFKPYGISVLQPARRPAYNLRLMEDSMLLYRLSRGTERRIYYVDVGQMSGTKVDTYVEQFKNRTKRKRIYNEKTQQVDERFNPWPVRRTTLVPLLDGRTITIEEIAREYEAGKTNWVFSVVDDTKGKIVPGKIVWCGKNYHCSNLIRVWCDDGGYVDVAPEHPFVLRNGSSKRADELKVGDSLMPLYKKISSKEDHKRVVGYPMVKDNVDGKWKFLHKIVADEALAGVKDEIQETTDWTTNKHFTVHHKNFDRHDASPENLEWLGDNDHRLLHLDLVNARWNGPDAEEVREKNREQLLDRLNGPNGSYLREKACQNLIAYNTSDAKRTKTSDDNRRLGKGKRLAREYNGSDLHRKHNDIRRDAVRAHWADSEKREAHTEALCWIIPNDVIEFVFDRINEDPSIGREELTALIRGNEVIMSMIKKANESNDRQVEKFHVAAVVSKVHRMGLIEKPQYGLFKTYAQSHAAPCNHQVIKIEYMTESDDVYCMTVVGPNGEHDRHNFAVKNSGVVEDSFVFVKNSVDDDLYIPVRPNTNTRVDTLPGAQNLSDIDDSLYFRKKLYVALKIPPGYLEQTVEAATNRLSLTSLDMRFAKVIFRIQKAIANAFREIAIRHLVLLGVPREEFEDLEIIMTPSSEWREMAQSEVMQNRINLASSIKGMDIAISDDWILERIFKLPDDEIEREKERKRRQEIERAELEGTKLLIAARYQAEIDRGNMVNQAMLQQVAQQQAAESGLGPDGQSLQQNQPAEGQPPIPSEEDLFAAAGEPNEAPMGTSQTSNTSFKNTRSKMASRIRITKADIEADREF